MYTVITCDHNGVHASDKTELLDDWVIQDRVPLRKIDEYRYLFPTALNEVIKRKLSESGTPADKPRMRTIELSEHRYNHSNKMTVWASRLLPDMYTTGRTALVEVPE